MMPAIRAPRSLNIATSVKVPLVAVASTTPSGSTSPVSGAGVTVIVAGARDRAMTDDGAAALAGRHRPAQFAGELTTNIPAAAPINTSIAPKGLDATCLRKGASPSRFQWKDLRIRKVGWCGGVFNGHRRRIRTDPTFTAIYPLRVFSMWLTIGS
jgi:hypothetical protein